MFPSVTFYMQKSQRREHPAWKRTGRSLLPPLPSPFLQRTCSAQSRLWPAQASLRGVSTVRTQHCGATCPPTLPSPLLVPPDLQSGAPMPHRPLSGASKTNDQSDFCFPVSVGRVVVLLLSVWNMMKRWVESPATKLGKKSVSRNSSEVGKALCEFIAISSGL